MKNEQEMILQIMQSMMEGLTNEQKENVILDFSKHIQDSEETPEIKAKYMKIIYEFNKTIQKESE